MPSMEELCAAWRSELFSVDAWKLDYRREPEWGALSGVWLARRDNAPFGAYLKPTTECPHPAAAREKIAADLAKDAEVPVLPVLLFDNTPRQFGAVQSECCVVLCTTPRHFRIEQIWTAAMLDSAVGAAIRSAAADALSRIAVFDLWIDNRDRDNGGNVILAEDTEHPARAGFLALDHDLSLGHSSIWSERRRQSIRPVPFPGQLRSVLDKTVMIRAGERIEALSDETIRACVDRIPERYMNASERGEVITGLCARKHLVKGVCFAEPLAEPP